ncbi:MAG: universal stress protein [Rhizobiaceae bacterium]|nr:universal stress protein [Rhizobiaceae bacterium]
MAFKTIFAVISVDQNDDDLQAAIDICAAAEAHLTVMVVGLGTVPPYAGYDGVSTGIWLDEREREVERLAVRAAAAKEKLKGAGISYDVQDIFSEYVRASDIIAEHALYADLTLIGGDMLADSDMRTLAIDGALFQSPTPVLLLPKHRPATLAPQRVLVAWDSRNEAGRAVKHAMDMLVRAERVSVVMVDPEARSGTQGEEPGADVATYLARQGIKVSVDVLSSGGREISDVLRQHALDIDADLIVMGGYGHSRMRERIFGGVTHSMIEDATAPVFMAR